MGTRFNYLTTEGTNGAIRSARFFNLPYCQTKYVFNGAGVVVPVVVTAATARVYCIVGKITIFRTFRDYRRLIIRLICDSERLHRSANSSTVVPLKYDALICESRSFFTGSHPDNGTYICLPPQTSTTVFQSSGSRAARNLFNSFLFLFISPAFLLCNGSVALNCNVAISTAFQKFEQSLTMFKIQSHAFV